MSRLLLSARIPPDYDRQTWFDLLVQIETKINELDSLYYSTTTLADEATPSVAARKHFVTGGTTTITDFDDGVVGQTIQILSAHAITITDGAPIILHGSANFVMAAADSLTLHMFNDQVWNEVSRMVNL